MIILKQKSTKLEIELFWKYQANLKLVKEKLELERVY